MAEKRCKHCKVRIIKTSYIVLDREIWMHQPDPFSGSKGVYESCKLTVAEPEEEDRPPLMFHKASNYYGGRVDAICGRKEYNLVELWENVICEYCLALHLRVEEREADGD